MYVKGPLKFEVWKHQCIPLWFSITLKIIMVQHSSTSNMVDLFISNIWRWYPYTYGTQFTYDTQGLDRHFDLLCHCEDRRRVRICGPFKTWKNLLKKIFYCKPSFEPNLGGMQLCLFYKHVNHLGRITYRLLWPGSKMVHSAESASSRGTISKASFKCITIFVCH